MNLTGAEEVPPVSTYRARAAAPSASLTTAPSAAASPPTASQAPWRTSTRARRAQNGPVIVPLTKSGDTYTVPAGRKLNAAQMRGAQGRQPVRQRAHRQEQGRRSPRPAAARRGLKPLLLCVALLPLLRQYTRLPNFPSGRSAWSCRRRPAARPTTSRALVAPELAQAARPDRWWSTTAPAARSPSASTRSRRAPPDGYTIGQGPGRRARHHAPHGGEAALRHRARPAAGRAGDHRLHAARGFAEDAVPFGAAS